jgi:hypothetical protein
MRKQILEALRSVKFPAERRASVKYSSKDPKKGFMLGRVVEITKGYRLSVMTKKHPKLALLINTWMRKRHPSFHYTSIQVNKGRSSLHVDRMNCGPSLITALGSFSGAKLWSWGSQKNRLHDISTKSIIIDGNLPHMNTPLVRGERYSLVFFNMKGNQPPMPAHEVSLYRKLKFPPCKTSMLCTPTNKIKLDEAARFLRGKFGFTRRQMGDYNNRRIYNSYGTGYVPVRDRH